MDGFHATNKDPRPKRRRDRDNNYEIFSVGRNTEYPHYFITFPDMQGSQICMEIQQEVFELLDEFELEDLSFLNEVDNHYERSELTEASLNARAVVHQEPVEDIVAQRIQNQQLHRAITLLPEVQRRRLVMHYFGGLTYKQIADKEGCIFQAVAKSIKSAENTLKKYLTNEN